MADDPIGLAETVVGSERDGTPDDRAEVDAATEIVPGTAFGRYIVERKIGAGGMGMVFAARDPELDRLVALKVMRPTALRTRKQARANVMRGLFGDEASAEPPASVEQSRLLREARAAASVAHPNVVTIHDVGRTEGGVFIAMEFIRGRTLRQWWSSKPRDPAAIVETMVEAARGLAAAHAAGLVHRDFKPDNVMLGDDGRVVVVDFGLVRAAGIEVSQAQSIPAIDALSEELTREGTMLGTPAYMAPEQYDGHAIDARTDQFAFCVALWEGLVGTRPFRTAIPALLDGPPPPPRDTERLPPWRFEVLRRGLSLSPADRYPSMDALVSALMADPAVARSRRRMAVAVGVLALAGVGVWQGGKALARRRCEQDASRIATVWNDDVRSRLAASMAATGVPYAEETATKVTAQLDGFVDEWSTTRRDVCLASAFEDDPDGLIPGTLLCLDRSRASLSILLDATESIAKAGVRGSVSAAANMRAPSRCAEPVIARRFAAQGPPSTGVSAEVRDEVMRSSAMEAMGRYREALTLARSAAGKAQVLDAPGLIAKAQFRVGVMLERTGEYDGAIEALEQAAHGAAEVGEDGDAARAAVRLAYVLAKGKSDMEGATTWARWAESYLDRTEQQDDGAARALHGELGTVHGLRGDMKLQLSHHRRQLELARASMGADHPGLLVPLNNVGSSLTDVGEYAEALTLLEEAVGIQEVSLPDNHPDVAMTMTNIARLYWIAKDTDAAAKASRRALAIFTALLGPDHPRVGDSHGNLGLVLLEQGREDEALAQFERAVEIGRSGGADTARHAMALANLGDAERGLGRIEQAYAHHEHALRIYDLHQPDNPQRAFAVHGLGNDLRELERFDEALTRFETAREILAKSLPEDNPRLAIIDVQIGRTLLDLERLDDAEPVLQRVAQVLRGDPGSADKLVDALLLLARVADARGDAAQALEHAHGAQAVEGADQDKLDEVSAWLEGRATAAAPPEGTTPPP
ncbi:MAG: tetratricopeptide repeat protein [Deltaproteobacteria bacterium]|nr:tetratricopeptide repeat protein [Deltaproteobacteria bacterium]